MANGVTAQDIYDYVKDKIAKRELFPGNRLVEEDLAKDLNTSRTTVRSAITKLSYDGLVNVVPQKGTYVAKPTLEEMNQVYELRRVLESEAVKLAIPVIGEEALARMEECIEEQIELEKHYSMQQYVVINRRFHMEIVQATQNRYLERFVDELFNKTAIFLTFYDRSVTNMDSVVTHRKILDAIKAGDTGMAVEAICEDNKIAMDWIDI